MTEAGDPPKLSPGPDGFIDLSIEAEMVEVPNPVTGRLEAGPGPRQELISFRIMRSLRQIIQAVDLHSRHLVSVYSITGPQLVCLLAISENEPVTLSELAQRIYLSPSTVVGIVDRLEREGFVRRERSDLDRRVVFIRMTKAGEEFVAKAPSPIQDQFEERLTQLPREEQMQIADALEKVARLMGAERIKAAPVLQSGDLSGEVTEGPGV